MRRPHVGFGIERILFIHRIGKRYVAVLAFSFFGIGIFPFPDLSLLACYDSCVLVYRYNTPPFTKGFVLNRTLAILGSFGKSIALAFSMTKQ